MKKFFASLLILISFLLLPNYSIASTLELENGTVITGDYIVAKVITIEKDGPNKGKKAQLPTGTFFDGRDYYLPEAGYLIRDDGEVLPIKTSTYAHIRTIDDFAPQQNSGNDEGIVIPTAEPGTADCEGLLNSKSGCYQPLAPIKDQSGNVIPTTNFPTYLQAIYRIGIGLCFALGVIMFTVAGIEYIVSEAMDTKGEAKKRMTASIIGLLLALVSYVILNTINPDLLKLKDLNIEPPSSTGYQGHGAGGNW